MSLATLRWAKAQKQRCHSHSIIQVCSIYTCTGARIYTQATRTTIYRPIAGINAQAITAGQRRRRPVTAEC